MKKPKYIAATLALAVSLMGAGYAAWSETLTIGNTAETGELRVEFVNEGIYPYMDDFEQLTSPKITRPSATVESSITHGAKVTTVSISKMFPGSFGLFEAKIKNLGTIPAISNNIEVVFGEDSSEYLKEQILVDGKIFHFRPNPNGTATYVNSAAFLDVPLKDLEAQLNSSIQAWELKPGDFITFDSDDEFKQQMAQRIPGFDANTMGCLYYRLPPEADNNTQDQTVDFTIYLNFKQFNQ